jgi:transglutaminase-like putative cysteine protease
MPSLTIRHVTTYRYRQPVAFGEHRMMLRPRDSHDQRVIEVSLEISPEPSSLRFVQDAFGNHVGIARFSDRSKELRFESTVCLEQWSVSYAIYETKSAKCVRQSRMAPPVG